MERRTFIKGVAASSILGIAATDLQAGTSKKYADNRGTLRGKEFFLDIDYTSVNITGKRSVATTINGQIPGPTLVWQEGDTASATKGSLRVRHLPTASRYASTVPTGTTAIRVIRSRRVCTVPLSSSPKRENLSVMLLQFQP